MDYRDDRDALVARVGELEQGLAETSARADRAETELAASRAALNEREAELRKLRANAFPAPPPAASAVGSGRVVAALFLGVMVLMVACGALGFVFYRRAAPPHVATVAVPRDDPPPETVAHQEPDHDGPGSGGVVPDNEHLQWGSYSGPSAFPVRLRDDAAEDIVGSYRVLNITGTNVDTKLYVGAFNGTSFRRMWAAGPFGSGSTDTHLAVASTRALVTDIRAEGHVLDVKTGKELGSVTLTDRANRLCPIPGREAVWVEVADRKNVEVDLETFATKPAPQPATCTGDFSEAGCEFAKAPCVVGGTPAPETRALMTLGSGANAVTLGAKSPGTATLVAYAAAGKGWKVTVPTDPALAGAASSHDVAADLAGGLLVVSYELSGRGGYRLAAFDATNGERRWDVEIPRSKDGSGPRGITATETRVYVPHWTWLDIFDLNTGKVLGTIGKW